MAKTNSGNTSKVRLRDFILTFIMVAGFSYSAAADIVRGPYLQNATPTSITVMWSTDSSSDSRVEFGSAIGSLTNQETDSQNTTDHRVRINGLTPDTQYFYAVGSTSAREGGDDANHFFRSSPTVSSPTRIWALGDAGTGSGGQAQVRDSYLNFDNEHTDVVLLLGDNAYGSGTQTNYQERFFEMYPDILRRSPMWSTRGNHETDQQAYYDIFEHPTSGEAGGTPSGSEAYYSFDYGDIHFVCMDSFGSPRNPGDPQFTWLANDLATTTRTWIIAFWHHPPYSFGDHNSNTESGMRKLRESAVPILEQYGVDLVLSGHNHFYSRSVLINGHYGSSSSFSSSQHVVDGGDGKEAGDGVYDKGDSTEGGIYIVAGSAGTSESTGSTHPTSYIEEGVRGSLIIDIDGNRLDARFLQYNGNIIDYFTITKDAVEDARPRPPVILSDMGRFRGTLPPWGE